MRPFPANTIRSSTRLLQLSVLLAALVLLPAPSRARVGIGIEGGIRRVHVGYSNAWVLDDPAWQTAWSAGVMADVPVARRLSLVTGLRYVEYAEQIGVRLVFDDFTWAELHRDLTWQYLALPVLARVRPFGGRGPFLDAGLEPAYLHAMPYEDEFRWPPAPVSGLGLARPASQIFEQRGTFDGDPRKAYSNGNLSFACGAGWQIPVGSHAARLEGRWTQGLVDIARSAGLERRTRAFELLLGLDW